MLGLQGWLVSGLVGFLFLVVRHRVHYAMAGRALGCKSPRNFYPTIDPFLGLDITWALIRAIRRGQYYAFVASRFRSYGTTFVARRVLYDVVHTIDPDNLKHIHSTDFASFRLSDSRASATKFLLGNGIFVANGPAWSHARALLRPAFSRNNMTSFLKKVERHSQLLLNRIPTDGSPYDLMPLFFNFTMDIGTDLLVGRSTYMQDPGSSSERDAQFVRDYTFCGEYQLTSFRMGLSNVFGLKREVREARDRAWAYIDAFVDEAMELRSNGKIGPLTNSGEASGGDDAASEAAPYNLLLELVRDTDDRVQIRDQILNVLVASRDGTAGMLCNLFFLLARHPDVYQKLRQEVNETLHGRLPTEAELKKMKYLRCCFNEALRIYPPFASNDRQAAKDTFLPVGGGPDGRQPIFVKKGTRVLFYAYALHRREDVFGPNPEEFNPGRWEGLQPGWCFIPFGGGPRICIGQQLALTEASYLVCRIVQKFATIEPRDDTPFTERLGVNLFSKNGALVALTPN